MKDDKNTKTTQPVDEEPKKPKALLTRRQARPMKNIAFAAICCFFGLGFFISPAPVAAGPDPFQRYIIFNNELPFTVYPVIAAPVADNGGGKLDGRVSRIFVNDGAAGKGVPSQRKVQVNIPKNGVGKYGWYQAMRVFLFRANPLTLEKTVKDPNEYTVPDDPPLPNLCPNEPDGACWSGIAKAAYWKDAPAQIIEYTAMSKDWTGTNKTGVWPDQDDPRGVPYLDIDVSYVDDVYLPVAVTLSDTGATKYMGTTMTFGVFKQRITDFLAMPPAAWDNFAAYSEKNWSTNVFSDAVDRSPHIPAGFPIISDSMTGLTSPLYTPKPEGPAQCSEWPGCSALAGNCCPADDGTVLSCCGLVPYLIDKTIPNGKRTWNPSLPAMYARWNKWIAGNPCADLSKITSWPSTKPDFDQKAFCEAFRATVQWVDNQYRTDPVVKTACSAFSDNRNYYNWCVLGSIIGYTAGPNSGRQPESVQALLRSVPWGDGKLTLQYQWDKYLHYWAPYNSVFNLNPYIRMVKNKGDGIDAKSGYSFSIDDQWGNYQDYASGFIVDMGGKSSLLNQESFDPYQQYRLSLAAGWDHATVCGRAIDLNKLAQPVTFSFWKNGNKLPYCDIAVYPTQNDNPVFKYRLVEKDQRVTDRWTGLSYVEKEFQAVNSQYCTANSSASLRYLCAPDQTKLEPKKPDNEGKGLEVVYVSVAPVQRPVVSMTMPPPPKNRPRPK
jgi:hypothetical protein